MNRKSCSRFFIFIGSAAIIAAFALLPAAANADVAYCSVGTQIGHTNSSSSPDASVARLGQAASEGVFTQSGHGLLLPGPSAGVRYNASVNVPGPQLMRRTIGDLSGPELQNELQSSSAPEPSSLYLLATGFLGAAAGLRRKWLM